MDTGQAITGKGRVAVRIQNARSLGQNHLEHPSRGTLAGRCDAGKASQRHLCDRPCLTDASHGLPVLCAQRAHRPLWPFSPPLIQNRNVPIGSAEMQNPVPVTYTTPAYITSILLSQSFPTADPQDLQSTYTISLSFIHTTYLCAQATKKNTQVHQRAYS